MHQGRKIKSYLKNGEDFGVTVRYFEEPFPLGTAGSVKQAEEFLRGTFAVVSGDALTDVDLDKILTYHRAVNAKVTIVLKKSEQPMGLGVVETDSSGRVTGFIEKPLWEEITTDTVNTGIYLIEPEILSVIPQHKEFDFSNDLFPLLLKNNVPMFGYITEDYWCDLGTPEAYLQAHQDALDGKIFKKVDCVCGENTKISENSVLVPPVFIGSNVMISGHSVIGPYTVIGDQTIIENSTVTKSVLWDHTMVTDTPLVNTCIGSYSRIETSEIGDRAVIGSHAFIGKNSRLEPQTSVSCHVVLPPESEAEGKITENKHKTPPLWQDGRLTGIWQHTLNAEILQGVIGSLSASSLLIAYHSSPLCDALAELLSGFALLSGKNVYLAVCTEDSARYHASLYQTNALFLFCEGEQVTVEIIDEYGRTIPSQKETKLDFSCRSESLSRGKLVHLSRLDADFAYFVNQAIPQTAAPVTLFGAEPLPIHNVKFNRTKEIKLAAGQGAAVHAHHGRITDIYDLQGRVSTDDYFELCVKMASFYGLKSVFLPAYCDEKLKENAEKQGIRVLTLLNHKGNAMNECTSFTDPACLLAFSPAFYAQALAYYRECEGVIPQNKRTVLTVCRFTADRPEEVIRAFRDVRQPERGHVTVIPANDGFSFTAYGRFAREEYAPDMTETFIKNTLKQHETSKSDQE